MSSFARDNAWQRELRDTLLVPWYRRVAKDGRFVLNDKGRCALLVQKRMAVDTILQGKEGRAVYIEEKFTRKPRDGRRDLTNLFLEVDSCTVPGYESPGWMVYADSDYLLYCFHRLSGSLECFLIDFPELKSWFWPVAKKYREYTMPDTSNHTRGRLVPIAVVRANVKTTRFVLGDKQRAVA